jgi:WD repeat-containing protein 40A
MLYFHLEREKNTSINKNNKLSPSLIEHDLVVKKIVNLKEEKDLQFISGIDKIFASKWYDNNTIFAGTKDNKLIKLVVNGKNNEMKQIPLIPSLNRVSSDCCGIHSIAINPSSNLLVTGGADPSDLGVYKLPTMTPISLLTGHENWSFACDFLNDDTVISGSRDKSVCVWRVSQDDANFYRTPIIKKLNHNHKVRDLKVINRYESFATLSSDCTLKIWNQKDFEVSKTINLEGRHDLVSMAVDDTIGIIAVGSQSKISLYDIRQNQIIKDIPSLDDGQGVRSLNIDGNIVSIGGAIGRLSFFDLIKSEYIKLNESAPEQLYFKTGNGWKLNESSAIKHAIYTHNFNHSKTKLFVAGGPINYHDVGSYASVWS